MSITDATEYERRLRLALAPAFERAYRPTHRADVKVRTDHSYKAGKHRARHLELVR